MSAFSDWLKGFFERRFNITIQFDWTGYDKMGKWTYFTDAEVVGLDQELVARLDMARKIARVPFRITSGKRDDGANVTAGGVADSSHLKGLAVDLAAIESVGRFNIIRGLILAGLNRIGIYSAHVHVDSDLTKPQNVLWLGGKSH